MIWVQPLILPAHNLVTIRQCLGSVHHHGQYKHKNYDQPFHCRLYYTEVSTAGRCSGLR
jgi:hypothetical protein